MKFNASKPKYECLLLHGLCEHEGRMYQLAKFLQNQGCNVHVPTHLGHGERVISTDQIKKIRDFYLNDEKDLNLLKHAQCNKTLEEKYQKSRERVTMYDHLEELKSDLKEIANQSNLPVIIVGFSMGGLLALSLAESKVINNVEKLLLISPALRVNIPKAKGYMKPFSLILNGAVQLLHQMRFYHFPGTKWLGRRLSRSTMSMPCREVVPNVSEDRREQFIFQNDPLVAKRVPLSYLNAIQEMMLDLKRKDMDSLSKQVKIALTWSHGDSIVNPAEIANFSKQYQSISYEVTDYDCHDLLRAQCAPKVYKFIEEFILS